MYFNECDKIYNPPFEGTIFIDPDIITEDDPTTFVSLSYAGTGIREMYDRRLGWVTLEPYLFPAEYDDGLSIEIQVNPEFGSWENAQFYALKYAEVIGRLTTELRKDNSILYLTTNAYSLCLHKTVIFIILLKT